MVTSVILMERRQLRCSLCGGTDFQVEGSFHVYNSIEEVETFLGVMEELVKELRGTKMMQRKETKAVMPRLHYFL